MLLFGRSCFFFTATSFYCWKFLSSHCMWHIKIFQQLNTFHMDHLSEPQTSSLSWLTHSGGWKLHVKWAIICNDMSRSLFHYWLHIIYFFLSVSLLPCRGSLRGGNVMTSDSGPFEHLNINTKSQREQLGTLLARTAETAVKLQGEYMSLNVSVEFPA